MDQDRTAQSAYRVDGDLEGQVCGSLELLWNHRKRQEPESLRLTVSKLNPGDGTPALSWTLPGKVCQTPAINQNGLLILGVSAMSVGEINEVAAIKIADP